MQGQIRIAFAGTPAFAVPTLERLHAAGAHVGLVLSQPDRPAGRGQKSAAPPVKVAALARGLHCEQPADLRDPTLLARFDFVPDVLVVVAYGLLLPKSMLDWPRVAAVNVHASLLPRWRGAAPIQHALLAGDAETGISVTRMEAGLDRGPVYATRALEIRSRDTAADLHDRLAPLGADLLVELLPRILAGSLEPAQQDESRASYAPKIEKAAAALDWTEEARALERRVRAFNPWPVAEARTDDGRRLRIWQAEVVAAAASAPPGTVVAAGPKGIDVATSRDVLRLEIVQPPGAKPMSAAAYLAAHRLDGARFAS